MREFFKNIFTPEVKKKDELKREDETVSFDDLPGARTLKMTKPKNEDEINKWIGHKDKSE